ncbi:hypothetical protein ACFQY9_02430 [Microvirga aerilata]|uniref:hypothetical protein n=1 Tax=Microvirga aerilata TaxID=670292 RepID=UPI003632E67D
MPRVLCHRKGALIHTGYILWDRVVHGERFAGDTPRRIAADIKPELRPDDSSTSSAFSRWSTT